MIPQRPKFGSAPSPVGRRPRRSRLDLKSICYAAVAAGLAGAIIAQLGVGPFDSRHASATRNQLATRASRIDAQQLFPAPGPMRKVIDVSAVAPLDLTSLPSAGLPPVISFPAGPMSAIEATCEAAKQAAENQTEAYKQSVELQCEAAKQAYERAHP